jgi:aminopeptidase N
VKAAESLAAAQYKPNTDIDGIVSTDAQVAQQSLGSDGGIKVPTKAENKAAEVKAEASAKSQIELPKVIDQANQTYQLVEDLITHPGLKPAVGLSSKLDPRNYIAGTSAADFKVRLDQLQGQQFLQAFESLKGGGQITEVEGKKATDAMARMNTSQTEEEFIKSAKEFQSVIKAGLERSKAKAGGNQIMPNTEPMPQSDKPAPKSLVKGQKYKGWTYTGGNTAEERADPKNWTR